MNLCKTFLVFFVFAASSIQGRLQGLEDASESELSHGSSSRVLQSAGTPAPVGTEDWWIQQYCQWYHPMFFCHCLTEKTGNYQSPSFKVSEDAYVFIYAKDGPVTLKLERQVCGINCDFKTVAGGEIQVGQGQVGAVWSNRGWWTEFRYSVSNADGVSYYLTAMDVSELLHEMSITHSGLGSHKCTVNSA